MDPNETPDDFSWLPPELAKKAEWMPADGEHPEGMYLQVGGGVGETTATLRFFGDDLDPDELTRRLGCEPSASFRTGEAVTKDGRIKRKTCSWQLESRLERQFSINDHVGDILSRLSNDMTTWHHLARFAPDLFCGLFLSQFNQGDSVSPHVSGMLAARGIILSLDIYGASDD